MNPVDQSEPVGELIRDIHRMMQEMNGDVKNMNARMDKMDDRMEKMDDRMEKMDTRMEKMDARMEKMDARMEKMDARMEKMDARMEKMEVDLKQVGVNLKELETHFAELSNNVNHQLPINNLTCYARAANSNVSKDQSQLEVVPYRNGSMPGAEFPVTFGEFKTLSGVRLAILLNGYGVLGSQIPIDTEERSKLVAKYIGVPWEK
ncbi:autophagy protein APG6 [Rhizoctonia solani]|uniref:Autophagy protein APG6 n=1 Tax=Rhizoctonia solani TaxID=456999 RepID=A0A8H8P1T9_9AGAM|nr:autophagy protein APG6 [Rhizoctonia solani]QRW22777.1 autophagy protein APG6 [Rhizoctonia solani]